MPAGYRLLRLDTVDSTNAEAKRAKSAISGGVTVATCDQHARRNEPLFGNHNMFDALAPVAETVKGDAVFNAIGFQIIDQEFGRLIMWFLTSGCVHMVDDSEMSFRTPNR